MISLIAVYSIAQAEENSSGTKTTRKSFFTEGKKQDLEGQGPQVPRSFESGKITPFFTPPPNIRPPQDDNSESKKNWIFAKPEEQSAEDIFKVKGFGAKDKESKSQTSMGKFLQNEPRAPLPNLDALSNPAVKNNRTGLNSPGLLRQESLDNNPKNISGNNPGSVPDLFRGDISTQQRWNDQSLTRRQEFQQLFEPRKNPEVNAAKSTVQSLPNQPTTDFNKPVVNASDPWKNDLKSFSGRDPALGNPSARSINPRLPDSSFGASDSYRPKYQPSSLPIPKRPGDLFNR